MRETTQLLERTFRNEMNDATFDDDLKLLPSLQVCRFANFTWNPYAIGG